MSVVLIHSDCSQQTLGNVGHDDSNEEEDCLEPMIAKHNTGSTQEEGDDTSNQRDDADEVAYLLSNGSFW